MTYYIKELGILLDEVELECMLKCWLTVNKFQTSKYSNGEDFLPDIKLRAKNVLTFWSFRGKSDIWQKKLRTFMWPKP